MRKRNLNLPRTETAKSNFVSNLVKQDSQFNARIHNIQQEKNAVNLKIQKLQHYLSELELRERDYRSLQSSDKQIVERLQKIDFTTFSSRNEEDYYRVLIESGFNESEAQEFLSNYDRVRSE